MSIRKKLAAVVSLVLALTLCMPMAAFAATTTPPAGTKVMVWSPTTTGEAGGEIPYVGPYIKEIYDDLFGGNVTTDVCVGEGEVRHLPSLEGYSLVFVAWPAVAIDAIDVAKLQGVVDNGGRVVILAEHNQYSPISNGYCSQLASALGGDFYIADGAYGCDYDKWGSSSSEYVIKSERNTKSPLYSTGVEQNYVAPIVYSGKAQWVYRLQDYDWEFIGETPVHGDELKTITWCVDEAVSKGRLTIISDGNFFFDYFTGDSDTNPVEFMELLLTNALDNEKIVDEGGDPNEDFGDSGRIIPKSENENVSIDSDVSLKEIVPLTDEEKALVEAGTDVIVTIRVEDGEDKVSEADKKEIEKNLGENELGMYLDISMFKQVGDNPEVKLTTLGDKIKITANLPEELVNNDDAIERTYKVIRVHDGVTDILDAEYDPVNKKITFETDRFSSYAIVYNDVEKSAEEPIAPETPENGISPKTGALSYTLAIFAMAAIAGAGLVVANRRRER